MPRYLIEFVTEWLSRSVKVHGRDFEEAAKHIRSALEDYYGGAWCVLLSKDKIDVPEIESVIEEIEYTDDKDRKHLIWIALNCLEVNWKIRVLKHEMKLLLRDEITLIVEQTVRLHWSDPIAMCELIRKTITARHFEGGNWIVAMSERNIDISGAFRSQFFMKVAVDNMNMIILRQEQNSEGVKQCKSCD